MMLFAVASSMYADIVLKTNNSLKIVPKVCTTNERSIVYSYNSDVGEITVYTPDFLVDKFIKAPQQEYQSGNFEETAIITPTGVDIVPEDAYGYKNYYISSCGEANSQDEMIQMLQEYSDYPFTAFTDPFGNPACYIEQYTQFMYESFFGKKYPQRWYALIDGTIYEIEASRSFFNITYNEEDAVWTRTSEYINTYTTGMTSTRIRYEGVELERTFLTQNVFNNDDKWEYVFSNYGESEIYYYDTNKYENVDGTVTLKRMGTVSPPFLGYSVYNEDGQKLGNIPDYEIEIINGKSYILDSNYDENSGQYEYSLYSLDPNSETIDLVEVVQTKENRRLGAKRGIVTVDINAEQAGGEVLVSTPDGKVMASRRVSMGKTQVNDKPLPPGVYVVSLLKNNRVVESEKYIVQ